jgi:hypothetical protein
MQQAASGEAEIAIQIVYVTAAASSALERFHNTRALSGIMQGDFFLRERPL